MNPEVRDLYQRLILEHNARPHHRGPLPSATHEASVHNALCGDQVTLRLRVEGGVIAEAWFEGEGCALSRASASLLTLSVPTHTPEQALAIADELTKLVSRTGPDADRLALGDLVALEGVREVPARKRCATLPWDALRKALTKPG